MGKLNNSGVTSGTAGSKPLPTLSAPVLTLSNKNYCSIKNENSVYVTCYYSTTSGGTTYSITISANGSNSIRMPDTSTTYYFYFTASGYNNSSVANITGYNKLLPPKEEYYYSSVYRIYNPNNVTVQIHKKLSYEYNYGTYAPNVAPLSYDVQSLKEKSTYDFYFSADGWCDSDEITFTAKKY